MFTLTCGFLDRHHGSIRWSSAATGMGLKSGRPVLFAHTLMTQPSIEQEGKLENCHLIDKENILFYVTVAEKFKTKAEKLAGVSPQRKGKI